MVYLVYSPPERYIAEQIAEEIERSRGIQCMFAPLGLQALSNDWQIQVERDLQTASQVILVITDAAVRDESVLWRFQKAVELRKLIVPVAWGTPHFPEDSNDERLRTINYFNFIFISPDDAKRSLERIADRVLVDDRRYCFISYSRSESDFAAQLAAGLRQANVKTWRDAENITAGANWDREIEKALTNCSHALFIATPRSVSSENVMDELSVALNKQKTIIPLMLETCELPMRVHRAQWVDFRDGYDQGLKTLLEQLGVKS